MTDERTEYLASAHGGDPPDRDRLDMIREILSQDVTWSQPPPDVAERVVAAIGGDSEPGTQQMPGRRRWTWVAAAVTAAFAIVLLIAGMLGVFSTPQEQLIAMEGTDLEPEATGQASIRESGPGWWIRLELEGLPAADDGTYYEGWLWSDDGSGISIGTFHLRGSGESIVLWSGVDPEDYPSIWVTLEDEDGDPSASGRVVMTGGPPDS